MYTEINRIKDIKELEPIVLLFGEEKFHLEETYLSILNRFKKFENADFNIDILDAEEASLKNVIELSSAFPFMSDRRLVVVKRSEKLFKGRKSKKMEKELAPFFAYLRDPQPETILLFIADIPDLNNVSDGVKGGNITPAAEKKLKSAKYPFNEIINHSSWQEFPKIKEFQLPDWIAARCKRIGKSISPDAALAMIAQAGTNLHDLSNEINKLDIFLTDKNQIDVSDILALTGASKEENVFELQNAVGQKNFKKALVILEKLVKLRKQEMLIIAMLFKYFYALWKLIDARHIHQNQFQLAKAVGVNPYFLKDYQFALSKYAPHQVESAIEAIHKAEKAFKSSGGDNMLIMERMIIEIMK